MHASVWCLAWLSRTLVWLSRTLLPRPACPPQELVIVVSEDAAGVRIPISKGIAGLVATSGRTENIRNAADHPLFDPTMDLRTGYHTQSILCMAVKDGTGTVVAVIQVRGRQALCGGAGRACAAHTGCWRAHLLLLLLQAINKIDGPGGFTDEDIKTLTVVADTAGVTLQKARLLQVRLEERGKRKRGRVLVEVAGHRFSVPPPPPWRPLPCRTQTQPGRQLRRWRRSSASSTTRLQRATSSRSRAASSRSPSTSSTRTR